MTSAGNRDVIQSRLQVLHVHVFLAAPLGARHVAKSGADQHQGGVAVRECPHHPRPSADLTVQPLDHIVCTDVCPMLAGKITVSQRLPYCTLSGFQKRSEFSAICGIIVVKRKITAELAVIFLKMVDLGGPNKNLRCFAGGFLLHLDFMCYNINIKRHNKEHVL